MTTARQRLSRDAVVDAALDLVQREGLAGLSVRRVAKDLGVTPMALYWHVADKEALEAALGERLFAGVVLPAPERGWRSELHAVLRALALGLQEHAALAPLALATVLTNEAGLVVAERVLSLLRRAGLPDVLAAQTGAQLLSGLVALVEAMPGADLVDEGRLAQLRTKRAAFALLDPSAYPTVLSLAEHLIDCDDQAGYLERGVQLLAGGVDALVKTARA